MNLKILGLLAVGLLAGPMYANATDVSWDLNGVFTEKDPSGTANIPINVGDSFSFRLTYNPSGWVPTNGVAPANCTATRCQYDIPSLSLANQHYASLSPVDFGLDNPFFRLYNANAFPGVPGGADPGAGPVPGADDDGPRLTEGIGEGLGLELVELAAEGLDGDGGCFAVGLPCGGEGGGGFFPGL
jgi:hypothetical protein